VSTAAAVSAESLALAAGVRNESVLRLIGVTAAAMSDGLSIGNAVKGGAAWGAEEGLSRTMGERNTHIALAILNALNALLYVINHYRAMDAPAVLPSMDPDPVRSAGAGGGEGRRGVVGRLVKSYYTELNTEERVGLGVSAIIVGGHLLHYGVGLAVAAGAASGGAGLGLGLAASAVLTGGLALVIVGAFVGGYALYDAWRNRPRGMRRRRRRHGILRGWRGNCVAGAAWREGCLA